MYNDKRLLRKGKGFVEKTVNLIRSALRGSPVTPPTNYIAAAMQTVPTIYRTIRNNVNILRSAIRGSPATAPNNYFAAAMLTVEKTIREEGLVALAHPSRTASNSPNAKVLRPAHQVALITFVIRSFSLCFIVVVLVVFSCTFLGSDRWGQPLWVRTMGSDPWG